MYLIIIFWSQSHPLPTLLPPPVGLSAHQQEGSFGAAVADLRHPLGLDVLEAGVEHDAEADQEHVRVGVGDGPQPVVCLLARRVEQGQVAGLPTAEYRGLISPQRHIKNHQELSFQICDLLDHDVAGVGVEHGGDVLVGEGLGGVHHQETRLAHGAVPHHHTLDALHREEGCTVIHQLQR